MIVGVDIDGTITASPAVFADLGRSLLRCGHQVLVITGDVGDKLKHGPAARQRQLADLGLRLGVHYSRVLPVVAHDPADLAHRKAALCRQLHVALMVDNDPLNVAVLAAQAPDTLTLKVV